MNLTAWVCAFISELSRLSFSSQPRASPRCFRLQIPQTAIHKLPIGPMLHTCLRSKSYNNRNETEYLTLGRIPLNIYPEYIHLVQHKGSDIWRPAWKIAALRFSVVRKCPKSWLSWQWKRRGNRETETMETETHHHVHRLHFLWPEISNLLAWQCGFAVGQQKWGPESHDLDADQWDRANKPFE